MDIKELSCESDSAAGQRGTMLIGLIIILIIVSVLGTAMLSFFSTSTMSQLGGNSSMQAYYLAESGFRYVDSQYRSSADKETILIDLHESAYEVADGGKFKLAIYPFYYRVAGDPGGDTELIAHVPGGIPDDLPSGSWSGRLKIGSDVFPYISAILDRGTNSITFTIESGTWPSIKKDTVILPSSRTNIPAASSIVIGRNGNIELEAGKGSAQAFPLINGSIRIYESPTRWNYFTYEKRNDRTLEGILLANDPGAAFSLTITGNTDIVMDKYVQVKSTGIVEEKSDLKTEREILYSVPLPDTLPTEKVKALERFEDGALPQSFLGGIGQIGGHEISGGALHVTSTDTVGASGGVWSRIYFNWNNTSAHLGDIWKGAGHLLGYDLQVKIRVDNQPYYMAGMSFRETGSGNYGVSYVRARQKKVGGVWVNDDGIPSGLKPLDAIFPHDALLENALIGGSEYQYSMPVIVLWKKTGGIYTWLAYKILSANDYVVFAPIPGQPEKLRPADWSNIQVRLTEAYPLEFKEGEPSTFLYGDMLTIMRGAMVVGTARVNGTPVITSDNWVGKVAAGLMTLSNVELEDGMTILLNDELMMYGVKRARVAAVPSDPWTKTNFIRVYYGDVDEHPENGPFNDTPLDNIRGNNPRITDSGQAVHWPVENVSEWAADNDNMTLVQWTGFNAGIFAETSIVEPGALIRDGTLQSPDENEGFDSDRPEISLHTFGDTSTSIYFDDFAIQAEAMSGRRSGILPPVQR